MKQTNNAIKFLMAQYRAIFKNANIAMVAAMVASALAAGQAQAAADTTNPDKIGTSELNDNALSSEELKLDSGNKTVVLDAANSGSIALNKDGKITLTTNATSHIFTKNDLVAEYVNVFFKILFLDMVPLASASIKRILIGICRFELFRLVMACDT